MAERINVFISSTSRDLKKYRESVSKVILRVGMYPIDMDTFNSTDRNALQLCYDKVQDAEIFIGIYAYRYGYAPGQDIIYRTKKGILLSGDSNMSITHLEYLWAVENGLPMLLFIVSDEDENGQPLDWPSQKDSEPNKTRLENFKKTILSSHVVGFFYSPDHLASQVATGLAEISKTIQNQVSRVTNLSEEDVIEEPLITRSLEANSLRRFREALKTRDGANHGQ